MVAKRDRARLASSRARLQRSHRRLCKLRPQSRAGPCLWRRDIRALPRAGIPGDWFRPANVRGGAKGSCRSWLPFLPDLGAGGKRAGSRLLCAPGRTGGSARAGKIRRGDARASRLRLRLINRAGVADWRAIVGERRPRRSGGGMNFEAIPIGKNPPYEVNVVIEVPIGGEPIKYEMDKKIGALFVDRFLYTSMRYPGNYGFIPHTLSEDGDPCDVIVANTRAIVPGAIMSCRPVGVLMMQDEAGGDEKIIAVPTPKLTRRYERVR